MNQTYFLEPLDVLLFRDGRPSVTGDSHVLRGVFPPPASAVYGAFRSALLAQAGARFHPRDPLAAFRQLAPEVAAAVGRPDRTGTLTLTQMLPACIENGTTAPLFRTPADLVRPKGEEEKKTRRLVPLPHDSISSSLPKDLRRLGLPEAADFVEPLGGWLSTQAFSAYLRGKIENIASLPDPFETERRTSVSLHDPTGTAAEGMLYSTDFTRLQPGAGLCVSLSGAPGLGEEGVLRLGGEQRPVAYRAVAAPPLPAADPSPGGFRLVLTSPAPFAQGWKPDFVGKNLTGTFAGCRIRLLAAAVGRYEHIGGWDLAAGRPKPVRRAAPAGSVYFFELLDGDVQLLRAASGRSVFPADDDRARHGLGVAFIGTL